MPRNPLVGSWLATCMGQLPNLVFLEVKTLGIAATTGVYLLMYDITITCLHSYSPTQVLPCQPQIKALINHCWYRKSH